MILQLTQVDNLACDIVIAMTSLLIVVQVVVNKFIMVSHDECDNNVE